MSGLLPVADALARIVGSVDSPSSAEDIPVEEAFGRVLAAPLVALRTQPPFTASAMDGYAVRAGDVAPGQPLRLVGESAAGRRFAGQVGAGEAVRIFTGAPVPEGADSILIQENAEESDGRVIPREPLAIGRHIRPAGLDFNAGQTLFAGGQRLGAKDLALAAALGAGRISVRSRPRVAVLATGDELVSPGAQTGPDQIVASNHLAVMALAAKAGAQPRFFGIAADDLAVLAQSIAEARAWGADILVTLGGASVGDRDLVKAALADAGMDLGFWRIAMRPGKPLMFGRLGLMRVLGLPGNPASAVVCAHLFLRPLIAAFLGEPARDATRPGRLGAALPANDQRQDYLRAALSIDDDGLPLVTPLPAQDSSLPHLGARGRRRAGDPRASCTPGEGRRPVPVHLPGLRAKAARLPNTARTCNGVHVLCGP